MYTVTGILTQAPLKHNDAEGSFMQTGQTKYGIGMTVSACLWLGLFPLLHFGTFSSITRDKWILMLILTGVSLVCFVVDLICRRVSKPRLLPLLLGGALLVWIVLSCLLSPYPGSPWWIGAGRREGLSTQLCYLALFFLFSFSRVRRLPVVISAVCGVFAFLLVVLLQRAGQNPFGLYPGRHTFATAPGFQGTIGNVDMCAGYLLIVSGLFFPALVDSLGRVFRRGRRRAEAADETAPAPERKILPLLSVLFLLLALAACVYLFFTMDVRFGILTLGVLTVWTLVRFLPKKFWLPAVVLLLAAALLVVWYWPARQPSTLYEFHEVLQGRPKLWYGSGRIGVWTYTLDMLKEGDHLLFGTGADTFATRFNEYLERFFAANPEAGRLSYYYDNPHCDYLALVVNCGIPAALFFAALVILGCFGKPAWRDSVLCYGIQALLSFSVCLVTPMFWVVLGMSFSMQVRKKPEASASGADPVSVPEDPLPVTDC